jgi:hydroxybutyrate-dimer hydrolase
MHTRSPSVPAKAGPRAKDAAEQCGEDKMSVLAKRVVSLAAAASLAAGIGVLAGETAETDETKIIHTHYDGVTNDLLTAGLGKTGLGGSTPPGFADPLHPTAEELRRSAIYNNYRALIDPTPGGGYGTLYGPNVKPDGTVTATEGLIPGDEYIAYNAAGKDA